METPVETSFSDFIDRLQMFADDPVAAKSFAENYLTTSSSNFPLIEGNTAHFITRDRPDTVIGVGGDWNGWDPYQAPMLPIGGGLLHYQQNFEIDARLDYYFYEADLKNLQEKLSFVNTNRHLEFRSQRDSFNIKVGESGFGLRSELAMPGYSRPTMTLEQAEVKAGVLQQCVIKSKILNQERRYTIYLPPDYDAHSEAYPSIYFHDGGDYLTMGKAPIILDNLINKSEIRPVVAVFVPPVNRNSEYNCNDQFLRFYSEELIPELQQEYNLSTNAAERAVFGPSLGGLISLYFGSQRPDIFGQVGAQSSAIRSQYGSDKYDARKAYAVKPGLPVRLHLVIGTYEDCFGVDNAGRCIDLLNPVRELCSVLGQSGYDFRYAEHHQGHSWGLWRDTLPDALNYFFARFDNSVAACYPS